MERASNNKGALPRSEAEPANAPWLNNAPPRKRHSDGRSQAAEPARQDKPGLCGLC